MDTHISHHSGRGALMERLPLHLGYRTDKGLRRSNNEDSYAVFHSDELTATEPNGTPIDRNSHSSTPVVRHNLQSTSDGSSLFPSDLSSNISNVSDIPPWMDAFLVVADGMGGTRGGEIASNIVVNTMPDAVRDYLSGQVAGGRTTNTTNSGPIAQRDVVALLDYCIRQSNAAVWHRKQKDFELSQMGTTCVSAIIHQGLLTVGHVGDSRAYLLRQGQLRQLTDDHSQVWEQVKAGNMTPQQAATSRFRNTITRAVGIAPEVMPDIRTLPLEPGDRVLLCSDGLSTEVDDHVIAQILANSETPQQAADLLVAKALDNGGSDNVTVVVVLYGDASTTRSTLPDDAHPASVAPTSFRGVDTITLRREADDEDITDPNQDWKRSLTGVGTAQKPNSVERKARQEVAPSRGVGGRTPGREYATTAWEPEEQRAGIPVLLFALVCLLAITEAILLGAFWTGSLKLPRHAGEVSGSLSSVPPTVRPTDGPLRYDKPVRVSEHVDLWDRVLHILPDGRIMVMTNRGEVLAIAPGGSVATIVKSGVTSVLSTQRGEAQGGSNKKPQRDAEPRLPSSTAALPVMTVDVSGNRYVVNSVTRAVDKYDPTGTNISSGIGKGIFKNPSNIIVDKSGDIYLVDAQRLMRVRALPDIPSVPGASTDPAPGNQAPVK